MATTGSSAKSKKGKLYTIEVNEIADDPAQPRQSIDQVALTDLATSLTEVGVIEPVVFRCDAQGNKVIVAGA